MYNHFQLGMKYLQYFFTASNGRGHGIHSPFVFDFVQNVLIPSKDQSDCFLEIENLRKKYHNDNQSLIEVDDLGAGSFSNAGSKRSVAQIAKGAAKHPKFARLLHSMVRYYEVSSVIELGTSLGLTTRYMALAGSRVIVHTIEGATGIAEFTRQAIEKEEISNIQIQVGDFKNELPKVLERVKGRKLIFFDGNHQYEPTKCYFEQVLSNCEEDDVLVFDDIHWSKGMEKAWQEIKKNERVSCSVDLFFLGIVFLRKEFKEKLDFTIRY
jgi:predicted O-methyltransferase YrrM